VSFLRRERRAWSFRESSEAGRAIRTTHRVTVVVHYDYALFADEKMPVASDAVVEPRLALEQHAVGERPNSELMSEAFVALLTSGEVVTPKFHEIP